MTFKIIYRNLLRHKLRTVLTVMGVAIAVSAFVFLRTTINMWYVSAETSAANRLVSRSSVSIVFQLPLAYKERIKSIEGVEEVSYANWFGGIYKDPSQFFAQFAVEPETYFKVYPEFVVAPEEMQEFLNDRTGVIVGQKLAERYGWKIGDRIPITGTIYKGDYTFTVRAIYRGSKPSVDETAFIFNWKYLDETAKSVLPEAAGQVGWYVFRIKNPDDAPKVCTAVDGLFANSPNETLTETESAFQLSFIQMSEAIIGSLQAVSFVIIAIMLLVIANTMSMSARERLKDYAIFKTLGYQNGFIYTLVVGEATLISFVGALLGLIIAAPITNGFGQAVAMFFPVFEVSPLVVVGSAVAAVIAGAVAGLVPAGNAAKTPITEGLRDVG
ncbi:MAG: FtsX-like permease family protein [Chloroherpetonaceae bacterium]|nr:FtsX-like permease family protein [Chloroherpetonaceae bacterium]